jgi:putative ATPase
MSSKASSGNPLADRMRPRSFEELAGQERVVGPGSVLRRALESGELPSMILWGPPGCGKTTLARLVAGSSGARFVPFSAVTSGIKEVREVLRAAADHRKMFGAPILLFVDEIHRFNKAQQDAFLPYVESGDIVFIGATTENPSFEVNAPLLSRARVYVLEPLAKEDLLRLLRRALEDGERGLAALRPEVEETLLALIAAASSGDARAALGVLELVVSTTPPDAEGLRRVSPEAVEEALGRGALYYDRAGEEHFNLISALHKSLRNSDPDASLHWLARMLESGEDPLYVARRLVRFASEDVGLADPRALGLAMAAQQAAHFIGLPEAKLALAELVLYLAAAPKSNAVYTAYSAAARDVLRGETGPVPLALRNAPTRLMEEVGYGEGYEYAHDLETGVSAMECLPASLRGRRYYRPGGMGFEKTQAERMAFWEKRREQARRAPSRTPQPGSEGKKDPDRAP